MRKTKRLILALLAALLLAAWWLTHTPRISELPSYEPNAVAGERMFWAGGCASCHATPVEGKRAKGDDKLLLGGGMELDTPFGLFRVPNISPDIADGIGRWTTLEFVNAMQRGVAPDGRHYYPSFPYTSYARMRVEDVMDLKAYLDSLPSISGQTEGHELDFPYSVRRGLGLWKRRYLDDAPVIDVDDEQLELGRYLVEGAGHCAECHTSRDGYGGMQYANWMGGAPNLDGEGRIPDITPSGKNTKGWSASDIEYYLESGFTPDFDSVGGTMVAVQENMAKLTDEDRAEIAAYLKALPPASTP